MDLSSTQYALAVGLGLLGFIEPCTIGGHLIFLDTQTGRGRRSRLQAVSVFVVVRSVVAGLFGALVAGLGALMIGAQTGLWLILGAIYLAVGFAVLSGYAGGIRRRVQLGPAGWKRARHPALLGLAFGLNIPACAAPILFGLMGLAAVTGTVATGFWMMLLFGLSLSLPLVVFAAVPQLAGLLENAAQKLKQRRWILALVFLVLGIWSMWFGLYVNPVDWSSL